MFFLELFKCYKMSPIKKAIFEGQTPNRKANAILFQDY